MINWNLNTLGGFSSGRFSSKSKNKILKTTTLWILDYSVRVEWKKVRYLRLKITPLKDTVLSVSAPSGMSEKTITEFIISKEKWIRENLSRLKQSSHNNPPILYQSNETHFFKGKGYRLQVEKGKKKIELDDNKLKLIVNLPDVSSEKVEIALHRWYHAEITKVVPDLIEKWESIIGVEVKEWRIKKMKTRWGTCNIRDQRVWLNLELIKKSIFCLEYVIVHELVHLLERYHNQRFYNFMTQFLPNWKEFRDELNEMKVD